MLRGLTNRLLALTSMASPFVLIVDIKNLFAVVAKIVTIIVGAPLLGAPIFLSS